MKLEDAVCSLELAKKLKELGIIQKSLFYWEFANENCYGLEFQARFVPFTCPGMEKYSAFTVPELLEIFPIKNYHYKLIKEKDNEYLCSHYSREEYLIFRDDNSSNACAKMLIHIIENKLYDPIKGKSVLYDD